MLKRFENGYFALVLVCLLGLIALGYVSFIHAYSKGYQRADKEHSTYYAERETAEKAYHECLNRSVTLNAARECVKNSPNRTRDAERAEQDLNAQREMAQWAEGMLWASWGMGILSILVASIGAFYVYLTLAETRRIGEAQVRAYLSVSGVEINVPGIILLYFELKNSGQSPTKNVEIFYRMEIDIKSKGSGSESIVKVRKFICPDIPANTTQKSPLELEAFGIPMPIFSYEIYFSISISVFGEDVFGEDVKDHSLWTTRFSSKEISAMKLEMNEFSKLTRCANIGNKLLTESEIRKCNAKYTNSQNES